MVEVAVVRLSSMVAENEPKDVIGELSKKT